MIVMTDTEGHLIEQGFAAFAQAQAPLTPDEIIDLRIAFYAGAHHLLATFVRAARNPEAGVRLDVIDREIREFTDECALRCAPCAGSA
jgi:hypothetical protein